MVQGKELTVIVIVVMEGAQVLQNTVLNYFRGKFLIIQYTQMSHAKYSQVDYSILKKLFKKNIYIFFFSWSTFSLCTSLLSQGKREQGGTPEEVAELGGSRKGRFLISRLFHAAEFISQRGYVFFVIAKLWCTSRLSPEANRTVAVRLSG